jgi:hypothetical protein
MLTLLYKRKYVEYAHKYLISTIGIKLLIEKKLMICALGNLHFQISREKFEPGPRFESRFRFEFFS